MPTIGRRAEKGEQSMDFELLKKRREKFLKIQRELGEEQHIGLGYVLTVEVDHTQKRGQKIKEKRRPNWEASHYYENEGGESYKSRGYT